ncbi:MAG TPA: hypothetical protein VKQ52_10400 [Puia sp.]|nr:hypothetical protein [Puia sp.]
MEADIFLRSYDVALDAIARATTQVRPMATLEETGKVMAIGAGVVTVSGLPGAGLEELLRFPGGLYGIAFDLDQESIGAVLLDDYRHLNTGDPVERTGRVMDVPVGEGLIGRVVDPLGRPLDGGGRYCTATGCPSNEPPPRSWTGRR